MKRGVVDATLFALYHLTLVVGIALWPVAALARRAGVPLPLGAAVARVHDAYAAR